MKAVCHFYSSTIGKKVVVALTGLALVGFLVGHMAGNLKTFGGVDPLTGVHKLDHYAEFLRTMGHEMLGRAGMLWAMRAGLLACLILHVVTVVQLRTRNAAGRPVDYVTSKRTVSSAAANTMFYGGLIILVFIVLHILHFTLGVIQSEGFVHGRVYANVYSAFSQWYVAVLYVFAMLVVAFHLYHGVWSMFQTLGLDNPDRNCTLRGLAVAASIVVFLGFVSVPISIAVGALPPPPAASVAAHGH